MQREDDVADSLSLRQQQKKALAIARAIAPRKVVGFDKIRIGRDRDGGYIHVNDFEGVGAALSFGIADDVSWDLDIANRGIPVHQFDHTIDKAPADHRLLTFNKQRIGAIDGPACVSLDTLAKQLLSICERAILKIDIEGDEWPVFNSASLETLGRFSQIVGEFHGFHRAGDAGWSSRCMEVLNRLRDVFEVVHVHGNNARPFANVGNVMLPQLIEITFANRKHYQFAPTDEIFPTTIDRPNLVDSPDLWLGAFRF